MSFAPKQGWSYVEARSAVSEVERLRAMTPAERFAVYADMYNVLWKAKRAMKGDWERLERLRWDEKLNLRVRMVDAYRKLDQFRSE